MSRGRMGVFLDRDGVVNIPPPASERYITRPEAFHLMPGIAEAIRRLNERDIPVAVVTNQKCVAIGRLDPDTLERIHARMHQLLQEQGARVDAVRYCPHREEDGCACRKPLPGMILDAARILEVDPEQGWMVGDQPRDVAAGKAAGCRTVWIHPPGNESAGEDLRLDSPEELPRWITENLPFQQKESCKTGL